MQSFHEKLFFCAQLGENKNFYVYQLQWRLGFQSRNIFKKPYIRNIFEKLSVQLRNLSKFQKFVVFFANFKTLQNNQNFICTMGFLRQMIFAIFHTFSPFNSLFLKMCRPVFTIYLCFSHPLFKKLPTTSYIHTYFHNLLYVVGYFQMRWLPTKNFRM